MGFRLVSCYRIQQIPCNEKCGKTVNTNNVCVETVHKHKEIITFGKIFRLIITEQSTSPFAECVQSTMIEYWLMIKNVLYFFFILFYFKNIVSIKSLEMINSFHNQFKRMQRKSLALLSKWVNSIIINNNLFIKWYSIGLSGNKSKKRKRLVAFHLCSTLVDTIFTIHLSFFRTFIGCFFFLAFFFRYYRMPHNEDNNVNKIQFKPDPKRSIQLINELRLTIVQKIIIITNGQ